MTNPQQPQVIGLRRDAGMPVTLTAAREWLQNNAATLAEQQAGQRFVTAYESRETAARDQRLADGINASTEIATQLALETKENQQRLANAIGSPEQFGSAGIKDLLAKVQPLIAKLEQEADGAAHDRAERERLRALDVAAYQEEQLKRFPATRTRALPPLLGEIQATGAVNVPKDVDTAESLRGHANSLQKLAHALVDELEKVERREAKLAGVRSTAFDERFPAMKSRR